MRFRSETVCQRRDVGVCLYLAFVFAPNSRFKVMHRSITSNGGRQDWAVNSPDPPKETEKASVSKTIPNKGRFPMRIQG